MKPLLGAEDRSRAHRAITAIGSDLACALQSCASPVRLAEAALFFAYAARDAPGTVDDDDAMRWLQRAVAATRASSLGLGLHGGATEVAWILDHLLAPDDDDERSAAAIEPDVLAKLSARDATDYDLVSGTVGLGCFGLQNAARPSGRAIVEAAIAKLEATAVPVADGLAWHTPVEQLSAWQRTFAPRGYLNLGLAHGIGGVLGFAARTILAGIAVDRATRLLRGAVAFVRAALPDRSCGMWVAADADGTDRMPAHATRSASWCYGTSGLASALAAAAAALDDDDLAAWSCALAHDATTPAGEAGLRGGCLCHGDGGVALALARLGRVHDAVAFGEAAAARVRRLLDAQVVGAGIGGFGGGDAEPAHDSSLLSGAVGIGLALTWAASGSEPGWSALLLLDAP